MHRADLTRHLPEQSLGVLFNQHSLFLLCCLHAIIQVAQHIRLSLAETVLIGLKARVYDSDRGVLLRGHHAGEVRMAACGQVDVEDLVELHQRLGYQSVERRGVLS